MSFFRVPAIAVPGAEAIGKSLFDTCVTRGPTILASGTYCCEVVMRPSDGQSGGGKNCRAIEGADGKNKCSKGDILDGDAMGSTIECSGDKDSLVTVGSGKANLVGCQQDSTK